MKEYKKLFCCQEYIDYCSNISTNFNFSKIQISTTKILIKKYDKLYLNRISLPSSNNKGSQFKRVTSDIIVIASYVAKNYEVDWFLIKTTIPDWYYTVLKSNAKIL